MMSTMNGKGGCCIARYTGAGGGGGGGAAGGGGDMSKVDKIMLKFRPIAPKPVSSAGSGLESSEGYVKCVRSKRKYVRVKKTKKNNNDCNYKSSCSNNKKRKVTLSLLPQTPARKENLPDLASPVQKSSKKSTTQPPPPVWVMSFNNNKDNKVCYGHVGGGVNQQVVVKKPPLVVSYVTVECVTGTWVDVQGLGCTDEERLMNLEKDTCPGFISDGQDRVFWTNNAYRKMAAAGDDVAVVLVRKDTWNQSPAMMYPAFTCKVRASSSAANSPSLPTSPTLTLPCDGWMMERGGYAWRLDVKAALSLGR